MTIDVQRHGRAVTITMDTDVARYLAQCVNEIAHGVRIDDGEFETRVGATKKEVRGALSELVAGLRKAEETTSR